MKIVNIKFENIAVILFGGFSILAMIIHAINGQTGLGILYEIGTYGTLNVMLYVGIKDIRNDIKKSTLKPIHSKGTVNNFD